MAFLDKQGLERLWDNIIRKLAKKVDKEDLNKTLESYATSEYVDEVASNSVQEVTTGTDSGLVATKTDTSVTLDWDPELVIILDCGTSNTNIEDFTEGPTEEPTEEPTE